MYLLFIVTEKPYRYRKFGIDFKVEVQSIVDENRCKIKYLKILKVSNNDISNSLLKDLKENIKKGCTTIVPRNLLRKW